jgi:putative addiction module component (TIGR02574 family)
MPLTLEAIEIEVLNLPAMDRSHLLDRLINSLEADTAIQEAWELEAERRDREIDEGKVQAVSGADLLARLHAQLQ